MTQTPCWLLLNWIQHIQFNGNEALKEVYDLLRNDCINFLMSRYNLNGEEAKDAFQLSIVQLYQNVRTKKLTRLDGSLKSYLFGIAKNKAMHVLRSREKSRRDKKNDILIRSINERNDDKYEFEERMKRVHNALIRLGDPCKSLLQFFYFNNMRLAEIAEIMGYASPGMAKTKKYKCLKRLIAIVYSTKTVELESK